MRKAQGMSMNVIIVAAIALLVLVILAVIFIGRMGKTAQNIDKCAGKCMQSETGDNDADCKSRFGTYYKATSDPCLNLQNQPTGEICCVGV